MPSLPTWPLQDVVFLRDCCARINHPFIPRAHLHCPPWCNVSARLLGSVRLPLQTLVLYAMHHTILVITILCKGQLPTARCPKRCSLYVYTHISVSISGQPLTQYAYYTHTIYIHIYIHLSIYICMYICTCIHIYIYTYTYVCISIYIYIHLMIHI